MNIIFIVGVGRSGTSLLQSMLNAHSKIASLPETQFFRKYLVKKEHRKKIENKGTEAFKTILANDHSFKRLDNSIIDSLKSLKKENLNIKDVYLETLEVFTSNQDKTHIVDKDPRNLDFVEKIVSEIENVKIIQIIRDPRDVILSKTKAKWSSSRPYWLHTMIGEAQLYTSHRKIKMLSNDIFYQIKYEDLIQAPEEKLKELTSFIGLDYEQSMLNFGKAAKKLVSKEEMQWKKETLGPLLKTNMNKWKKELKKDQIVFIEKISETSMKKFGYKETGISISLFNRVKILFFKAFYFFFKRFYSLRLKL